MQLQTLFGITAALTLLLGGCSADLKQQSQIDGDVPPDSDAAGHADATGPSDGTSADAAILPPPPPLGPPAGLGSATTTGQPCNVSSSPAIRCVAATSTAPQPDGSAQKPFASIQAAVDAAKNGDTIQVAGGNYRENVEVKGKGLTLLGGFAPDFASRDAATNVSTINGIGGNAVVALLDARQTTIEGFRITNGTGNELQRQYFILGGGIYGRGGTLTIRGNLIEQNNIIATHNNRENVGGGAFFESATVNFVSNVVRNNTGGRGAAIGTQDGDRVLIEGNLVLDNTAVGDHGGGIYVAGPNIEIVGNYISGNKVTFREGTWGGGVLVYNKGSKAQLRYNTITKNHATLIGSGVFIDDGAQVTLQNELIFGNVCPETGGAGLYVDGLTKSLGSRATVLFSTIAGHNCPSGKGQAVFLEAGSQVEIKNSILWGNGGDDLYADGSSSISAAFTISQEKFSGTQQTDPLFVDPKSDFHLRSRAGHFAANGNWVVDAEHSPAIDAADPTAPVGSETSPHGNRANLGAYGTTREASRSQSSAATPR